eukprot:scaffold4405_cov31-Tisochrysis_lutea.AAC.3
MRLACGGDAAAVAKVDVLIREKRKSQYIHRETCHCYGKRRLVINLVEGRRPGGGVSGSTRTRGKSDDQMRRCIDSTPTEATIERRSNAFAREPMVSARS